MPLVKDTRIADVEYSCRYSTPAGSYQKIYQNLHAAIREDKEKLIVKPEQAALTMKIIELAFQSSREGRTLKVEV